MEGRMILPGPESRLPLIEEYSSFMAIIGAGSRKTNCAELARQHGPPPNSRQFIQPGQEPKVIHYSLFSKCVLAICYLTSAVPGPMSDQEAANEPQTTQQQNAEVIDKVKDTVVETAGIVKDKAQEIGATLNESAAVHDVSQSILHPIYQAAEAIGQYPAFYWAAFALMVAGAVSFLLQLVLTKFLLLFRGSLNIKEILMDVAGLFVSLTGLILTTQAAAENSASFVNSPSAVLSAVALGAVVGLTFYIWGQRQEFQAVKGYAADRAREA